MSFFDDVKYGFDRAVSEYDLEPVQVSDRTVALIKGSSYILYISLNLHFELELDFVVNDGGEVVSFDPMYFIGSKRQDEIPRDQLNRDADSNAESLRNYQLILLSCGSDFLSGKPVWKGRGIERPETFPIAELKRKEAKQLLGIA